MADSDKKTKRGFAAMDKDKQREIASQGGRASGANRRSHSSEDYLMDGTP